MRWRLAVVSFAVTIATVLSTVLFLWAPNSVGIAEAEAPGTWVSSVTIQNLGTSTADVEVQFYDGTAAVGAPVVKQVGAGQNTLIFVPSVAGLPAGKLSAVVSSTQPVVAVTNLASSTPGTLGAYDGIDAVQAANSFFIPSAFKAYSANQYYSSVTVQNADTVDASVVVNFKGGATNFSTPAQTVKAGTSVSYDTATLTAIPGGFVGAATVTSTGGKVVAISNNYTPTGAPSSQFSSGNGQSTGALQAYIPGVMKNYSSFAYTSALLVQNVGPSATSVKMDYSNGLSETVTIQPGASYQRYQGSFTAAQMPNGFNGSVKVTSLGGQPILAVLNVGTANGLLSSYSGFADGTSKAFAPVIMNLYAGRYSTALLIQNVDTAPVSGTVTYGNGATSSFSGLAPNSSVQFFTPNVAGIPAGTQTSATITASGKIVAVVNEQQFLEGGAPVGAGDWLLSYNAFNQ